jgi:hypothetical protein
LNEKIQRERDKLLGKIGKELGIPIANQPDTTLGPNSSTNFEPNQFQKNIEKELMKGIENLFGK